LNDRCGGWCFDDWRSRSFNNGSDWRGGSINNRSDWRGGNFNNRSIFALVGCLLGRCLLGGLFFFDRGDLTDEASGFGFTLEHRYECFNQS
jgi:hypothetical protein